jgi:hypothetical protein
MKWLRGAAKQEFDPPSTNRAGEANAIDGTNPREDFERSLAAQMRSGQMRLAFSLLLKSVVTAVILSVLSYYFITRFVLVSGIMYP